jgi:spore maturation protein CgeB
MMRRAPTPQPGLRIVILGLSITSSWGNGHATTYRALVRALCRRRHSVLFLERETPWYREHRDLPQPPFGRTSLYHNIAELQAQWSGAVRAADVVIVGSYVPDGVAVARFVQETARGLAVFYDIDTPVTLAAVAAGRCEYLTAALIPGFDLYLSFTGGSVLRRIEDEFGAPAARALYCGVDPDCHRPAPRPPSWDLGYLGTFSADRQPALDRLLCTPARRWQQGRFAVAGSLYPDTLTWPANVEHIEHIEPGGHATFFARQRFTLNVTRADMIRSGYSPSVRLFEAAACGVPIISDWWPGLADVFSPDREVLIAHGADEVLHYLRELNEAKRLEIADNARRRVLACHTADHRASAFESYIAEIRAAKEHRNRPPRGSAALRLTASAAGASPR